MSLGSNLESEFGSRLKNLEIAQLLIISKNIDIIDRSSYYETISYPNKKNPKFINCVIKINTKLTPNKLLNVLLKIEKVIGNNPLPLGGKFEVTSRYRNPSAMELIVRKIKKIEGIDQASFRSGLITRIDNIIENLFNICIIVGIAIFILAIIRKG